jgi:AraC-like DNA-binding protein
MLRQLYDEFHADEAGRVEAISHLLQFLFIHIQRIYQESVSADNTETETRLTAEFQYLVGQQFAHHHRLSDYATQLGVSTGYLNARVKAVTGRTAAEHIRQRIVIEAMRLLTHTDMSAAEIALQIGFKDNAYFGRFFKRETGHTPLTFRQTRLKSTIISPYSPTI